ncbi:MAG: colanic acid biosynthesis glycosyltransferase WcaL [Gemmatimonadales bacterium]|nr:MAG: colanic acid biosynthesis glycosyltransferase WcaL [Gemmatimonadales bacterium]
MPSGRPPVTGMVFASDGQGRSRAPSTPAPALAALFPRRPHAIVPMKIAFVLSQFPAVSETFILSQITGMMDHGADVDILASTEIPQPVEHPALSAYGLRDRTRYAEGTPDGAWTARLRMAAFLGGALLRAPTGETPLDRLLRNGRDDARRALEFSRTPRRVGEYDVIHCHFGPMGTLGMAMRNMGLIQGRLVTTFHGYDMCHPFQEQGPDVYERLFREGDLFLPISDYWKERLIEHGCPEDRILVHRMGVDCDQFAWAERTREPGEPVRLLSVCRLVEKKGIEYAIRAVARVLENGGASSVRGNGSADASSGDAAPRIEYTIVGGGPLRPHLESLVDELGIPEAVTFAGSRRRDEVAKLMANAHVFLAPSVTAADGNKEGIPVAIMEAMATGLPVISSRHSGIPELVEDGVTGLLADERDVEGLAERLARLLGEPGLHPRLAAAGRRRVEKEFNSPVLNDRLMGLFRDLVGGRGADAGATASTSPVRGE